MRSKQIFTLLFLLALLIVGIRMIAITPWNESNLRTLTPQPRDWFWSGGTDNIPYNGCSSASYVGTRQSIETMGKSGYGCQQVYWRVVYYGDTPTVVVTDYGSYKTYIPTYLVDSGIMPTSQDYDICKEDGRNLPIGTYTIVITGYCEGSCYFTNDVNCQDCYASSWHWVNKVAMWCPSTPPNPPVPDDIMGFFNNLWANLWLKIKAIFGWS